MSLATPSSNTMAEPMIEMNMTPLIDVMLVLIIMLIITIPKQHHTTTLGMPKHAEQRSEPLVVSLEVDFDGSVLWNGQRVDGRAALEAKLVAMLRTAVPPQLQLRANKLAPYKTVAGVMATAQRLGVIHIGIVGNEQFL